MPSNFVNGSGQVKILSTNVAQQLPINNVTNGFVLTAKSTNTAPIMIGDSTVTNVADGTGSGDILEPGQALGYGKLAMNDLYIIGTSGDVLSFAGS